MCARVGSNLSPPIWGVVPPSISDRRDNQNCPTPKACPSKANDCFQRQSTAGHFSNRYIQLSPVHNVRQAQNFDTNTRWVPPPCSGPELPMEVSLRRRRNRTHRDTHAGVILDSVPSFSLRRHRKPVRAFLSPGCQDTDL